MIINNCPGLRKKRQARSPVFHPIYSEWSAFHLSRLNIAAFRQEINSARREQGRGWIFHPTWGAAAISRVAALAGPSSAGHLDTLISVIHTCTRQSSCFFSRHCIVDDKVLLIPKGMLNSSHIFADRLRSFPGTIRETTRAVSASDSHLRTQNVKERARWGATFYNQK